MPEQLARPLREHRSDSGIAIRDASPADLDMATRNVAIRDVSLADLDMATRNVAIRDVSPADLDMATRNVAIRDVSPADLDMATRIVVRAGAVSLVRRCQVDRRCEGLLFPSMLFPPLGLQRMRALRRRPGTQARRTRAPAA